MGLDFNNDLDLDKAADAIHDDAPGAITDIMEYIGERTDAVIPHDEGTLMRSKVIEVDDQRLQGAIGYDTPYAIRQHEDCSLSHTGGRKCKYLEGTVKNEQEMIQQLLKKKFGGLF